MHISDTPNPTPLYNASLLADMNLEKHLHYLYNASLEFDGFKDGMFLLKVWLHQRGLDKVSSRNTATLISIYLSVDEKHALGSKMLYVHTTSGVRCGGRMT